MTLDEALLKLRECDHYLEELDVVKSEVERLRAELALIGSCTLGVGDGSDKLFVHGSYEATKAVQGWLEENTKLRAENAELQSDVVTLKAAERISHAVRDELDWFRRREQQIKAQADARHLGAQLLAGYLAEYERANPKPGAGT